MNTITVTLSTLPNLVRYKGKIWRHINKCVWFGNRISLESLTEDGSGIGAEIDECYPASEAEAQAVEGLVYVRTEILDGKPIRCYKAV